MCLIPREGRWFSEPSGRERVLESFQRAKGVIAPIDTPLVTEHEAPPRPADHAQRSLPHARHRRVAFSIAEEAHGIQHWLASGRALADHVTDGRQARLDRGDLDHHVWPVAAAVQLPAQVCRGICRELITRNVWPGAGNCDEVRLQRTNGVLRALGLAVVLTVPPPSVPG